jgi:hypothetical protein
VTVTRTELLDCVESAFTGGAATRNDLIEAAVAADARNEVLIVLRELPDEVFASPRDLWHELPHLPINA